jgi:hypothetical protein
MLRLILIYGVIGGLIVGVPMVFGFQTSVPAEYGELIGYSIMVVAFSTIFIAVKQYRDKSLGGVIKFLPAFAIGLGISVIASLFYALAWELVMAQTGPGMMDGYFNAAIEQAKASGKTGADLAAVIEQTEQMKANYANPLYRMSISFFVEIFPVGLLISLISALLLRNSRFLPARPAN